MKAVYRASQRDDMLLDNADVRQTNVKRWLQLRLDFDWTPVRLFVKGH